MNRTGMKMGLAVKPTPWMKMGLCLKPVLVDMTQNGAKYERENKVEGREAIHREKGKETLT
jgi:hypothetical protein